MADTIQREVYVENELEKSMFLLKPAISEKYPDLNKDLSISHLDNKQIIIGLFRQDIMNIMLLSSFLPWMPDAFESFERDQQAMILMNKSKMGFEAKLQRAKMTGDVQGEKGFEKEKQKTIFGGNKGGT